MVKCKDSYCNGDGYFDCPFEKKDPSFKECRTKELLKINEQLESEIRERRAVQEILELRNNHLKALQTITIDIVGQLETDDLLKSIITKAGELLETEHGYITLYENNMEKVQFKVASGRYEALLNSVFESSKGVCGRVLVEGRPIMVKDYNKWEYKFDHEIFRDLNSIIGAPLKKGDQTIGVIAFGYFDKRTITDHSLDLLSSFAKLASITLSNANLLSEINLQLAEKERVENEKKEIFRQLLHSQKMEAIGTLAGGIAHDMNNILMAVLGNISLLKLGDEDLKKNQKRIKNIKDLVESGSRLTKQILGFARGGKYKVETSNINQIIKKTCDVFARTRKNIIIHEIYSDEIWPVDVDRNQMEQVFLNLFVNAYHAMPDSGELFIKTCNKILDVKDFKRFLINPGKYAEIVISDTGKGMTPEIMERIFEPFFTTKTRGECSGLGLASAYGIIKNHNGIIDVKSKPGKGSSFIIYLPISEKEIPVEMTKPETKIKGKEKILIIDDEDLVRDICCEYLEELGYEYISVQSGHEGVEIYKENHGSIDMVIVDFLMPEMSGEETFEELKKINKDVKVLLSSGYSLEEKASDILSQAEFIQKPFGISDFSNKIREVLSK